MEPATSPATAELDQIRARLLRTRNELEQTLERVNRALERSAALLEATYDGPVEVQPFDPRQAAEAWPDVREHAVTCRHLVCFRRTWNPSGYCDSHAVHACS